MGKSTELNLGKKIRTISDLTEIKSVYRHLVIYGAGEVALQFWDSCYNEISTFKSVQIIVTKPSVNIAFHNMEIFPYTKLRECNALDHTVIVATHENVHKEIYALIKESFSGDVAFLSDSFYREIKETHVQNNLRRKRIALHYIDIPNMGDQLNKLIIPKCFGYEVEWEKFSYSNLFGIGSYLSRLFVDCREVANAVPKADYPLYIWGTGFSRNEDITERKIVRNNTRFCCVRGNLSKRKLESYYGTQIDCTVGDPALLIREIVNFNVDKHYSIGIIPHYREQDLEIVRRLYEHYDNAVLINLRHDVMFVVRQIAECEVILTSSLHGAIVADALGIPNILVKISDIPYTDGFKYDDYYSAYEMSINRLELKTNCLPETTKIKKDYAIREKDVQRIAMSIKNSFPILQ